MVRPIPRPTRGGDWNHPEGLASEYMLGAPLLFVQVALVRMLFGGVMVSAASPIAGTPQKLVSHPQIDGG